METSSTHAALATELEGVNAKLAELAAAWAQDALTRPEWTAARAGRTFDKKSVKLGWFDAPLSKPMTI